MMLLLLILPALAALASLLVGSRKALETFNPLVAGLSLVTSLALAFVVLTHGPVTGLGGHLYADALSVFEVVIASGIALMAMLYSRSYMSAEVEVHHFSLGKLQRYYALVNAFMAIFMTICLASSLGIVWIGIEGTTLATVLLVAFYNRQSSVEAAWKYFVLCSVGISLALMGLILVYFSATRTLGAEHATLHWPQLAMVADRLDPAILKLAFVFILIGYGTKVGLAPMHTWLPDAHSEAPAPVSALLSGVLLNGAMYGIIRAHSLLVRGVGEGFSNQYLILFGIASVCVAVPFILWQRDFKRLLAYSSVEHMGLIALGLGFGGVMGTFGALLHTLYHSLIKSGMFFSAGNFVLKYHSRDMGTIKGALKAMPVTGPAMLAGAFAIAGAPPFGLFLSEFTILGAGFAGGHWVPSLIVLLAIILVFAGFVAHASRMAFGEAEVAVGENGRWSTVPLVAVLVLGVGLYLPSPLANALQQVVQVITGAP